MLMPRQIPVRIMLGGKNRVPSLKNLLTDSQLQTLPVEEMTDQSGFTGKPVCFRVGRVIEVTEHGREPQFVALFV